MFGIGTGFKATLIYKTDAQLKIFKCVLRFELRASLTPYLKTLYSVDAVRYLTVNFKLHSPN